MIISSIISAVDPGKAWTDSQHCNQRNDLQVPTAGFLFQEGREGGGEIAKKLTCIIARNVLGIKFSPNYHAQTLVDLKIWRFGYCKGAPANRQLI
jgi:hypothetical protein